MSAGFKLGTIIATPGAVLIADLLCRHAGGDWSDLDAHDRRENERGVHEGLRIFSYITRVGRIWIITAASSRTRASCCRAYWGRSLL